MSKKSKKNKKKKSKKKSKKKKKKDKQERSKELQEALDEIKQQFGEGAIMDLSGARKVDVDTIPTGAISLDLALGVGGIPKGRVMEVFGPEASGKSTLALHIVAECQKKGEPAAYVDAEHALDPKYSKKLGVKIDDLLLSQPDTGEQALQIVETLVRSGELGVIVVDSVAALTPKAEIEGEMEDQQIGLQARLMSKALRKLTGIVSKTGTTVIFLNQTRKKVGVVYGNPNVTSGGVALKFYSSVRIKLRRSAKIKQKDKVVGSRIKSKIVKNKVAPPFKTAEFDIYYNEGISKTADLINMGEKFGIVERSGSWYSYGDEKLGQGVKQSKEFLEDNPKIEKEIKKKIMKKAQQDEEEK